MSQQSKRTGLLSVYWTAFYCCCLLTRAGTVGPNYRTLRTSHTRVRRVVVPASTVHTRHRGSRQGPGSRVQGLAEPCIATHPPSTARQPSSGCPYVHFRPARRTWNTEALSWVALRSHFSDWARTHLGSLDFDRSCKGIPMHHADHIFFSRTYNIQYLNFVSLSG